MDCAECWNEIGKCTCAKGSQVATRATVYFSAKIILDEPALRALDAMAGYGADNFLKVFYEKLGRAYMEPHEAGLRSLLTAIKRQIPKQLHVVDEARRLLEGIKP